jgi:hypothetical protein
MQGSKVISRVVPERHGKRWEDDEDEYILKRIKEGALPSTIANEVKRSTGSIIRELKKLAYEQVKSGESIEIVAERTGLMVDDINEYIEHRDMAEKIKKTPKEPKPPQSRPFFLNKPEETMIDVLKDIRELLRELLDKKNGSGDL